MSENIMAERIAERERWAQEMKEQQVEHRRAFAEMRQRAEQAEMEREETLRMWREYRAAKDADAERLTRQLSEMGAEHDTQMERAEADNAALLQALLDAAELRLSGPTLAAMAERLKTEPHPGAALLERLRALEEAIRAILANRGRHTVEGLNTFAKARALVGDAE